jgi:hypothetical protein
MVSLGATSVIGQAFNGFILMFSRAYRAGDYVRIGENEGTVESLGTFVTRIRTGLGEELTLPNSSVMAAGRFETTRARSPGPGCVLDAGRDDRLLGAVAASARDARGGGAANRGPLRVARAVRPPDRALGLLRRVPARRVHAAHGCDARADALSRLHGNIQDVFNEYGVQILSPHYMTDPKEPQLVAKERWHAPPAPAASK